MNIVILIDCWAGYLGPLDLRSKMCENIKRSINAIGPDLIIFATYGKKLHPVLKGSNFSNTANALSLEEFKVAINELNLLTDIRCWFFGLHWNSCIKDRPMGWKSVYSFFHHQGLHIDLLSREDCTLKIPFELSKELEIWPDFEHDTITKLSYVSNGNWIIHPDYKDNQT